MGFEAAEELISPVLQGNIYFNTHERMFTLQGVENFGMRIKGSDCIKSKAD